MLDVDPIRARSAIEKAQKLTRDGLGEIRSSIAALRALPTENRSLPEALTDLVGESEASACLPRSSYLVHCPNSRPR